MISELMKLHAEATRVLTVYHEHQHSSDDEIRRKVHLDVDRFLMENRETAMLLLVTGLKQEIDALRKEHSDNNTAPQATTHLPWYKRLSLSLRRIQERTTRL